MGATSARIVEGPFRRCLGERARVRAGGRQYRRGVSESADDDQTVPLADRYPSVHRPAHTFRSRRANGRAALVLLVAVVAVVVLLAITA